MDKDDIIETLNDLIETSRDGEEGFRTCAEGVKSPGLKQLFEHAAARCKQAVSELQANVRSLGGERHQVDNHRDERSRRSRRVRAWRGCRQKIL